MASVSQGVRKLGARSIICVALLWAGENSLFALAQESAPSLSGKPAHTFSRKEDISENDKALFDVLLKKSFDERNELLEKEITRIAAEGKSADADQERALNTQSANLRKSALKMLETVLDRDQDSVPAIEARFRLALLLRKENPKRSLKLIDEAARRLQSQKTVSWLLFARVGILRGELLLKQGDLSGAEESFQAVLHYRGRLPETQQEEWIRAAVALGDVAFVQSRFEDARKSYEASLSAIDKSPLATDPLFIKMKSVVLVRLTWSSFWSGDYAGASKFAFQFARHRSVFRVAVDEAVEKDILRTGGLSFYEENNPKLFRSRATDLQGGDFAKRMIVSSFAFYDRAGRSSEVEAIARSLERSFSSSPVLIDLLEARWMSAQKTGDVEVAQEVAASLVEALSRTSVWKRSVFLDENMERKRVQLIAQAAETAGGFFYQKGVQTRNRAFYARSYALYQARLLETLPGERRGALFLLSGQSALKAEDYENAWLATQKVFSFEITEEEKRAAYYQAVDIGRQSTTACASREESLYRRYEEAVDRYVAAFPNDAAARLALFESARRAETLDDNDEARKRFERLLALLPEGKSQAPFLQEERDRVFLALSEINAKDKNLERSTRALGDLSRLGKVAGIGEHTLAQVSAADAALIREYASALRREGKLAEAAHLLFQWTRFQKQNPETPNILRDAVRLFAELDLWKECHEAAATFIANYEKHVYVHEMFYWKGRALEDRLAFSSAVEAYWAAAYENSSALSQSERREALMRAEKILGDLRVYKRTAEVREKLAELGGKTRSPEVDQWLMGAADVYLINGDGNRAANLYAKVMTSPHRDGDLRLRAELGLRRAQISTSFSHLKGREGLDILISRLAQRKNKMRSTEESSLVDALKLSNREDLAELKQAVVIRFGTVNQMALNRLEQLRRRMEWRVQIVRSVKATEVESNASLGRFKDALASVYALAGGVSSNLALAQRENFGRRAESLEMEAQRHLFLALSELPTNSLERAALMREVSKYGQNFSEILPPVRPTDDLFGSPFEVVRPALAGLEGNTSQEEAR